MRTNFGAHGHEIEAFFPPAVAPGKTSANRHSPTRYRYRISPAGEREPHEDGILAERIAAMPALTREVFLLRAVDQMSFEEISKHLAIARWRVKSHMRRAVTKLGARTDV